MPCSGYLHGISHLRTVFAPKSRIRFALLKKSPWSLVQEQEPVLRRAVASFLFQVASIRIAVRLKAESPLAADKDNVVRQRSAVHREERTFDKIKTEIPKQVRDESE